MNRQYVDGLHSDLLARHARLGVVRAAADGPSFFPYALRAGKRLDGVLLADGDAVLLTGDGPENGVYVVSATQEPVRAHDLAPGAAAAGYVVVVALGGERLGGRIYSVRNPPGEDVVGQHPLLLTPLWAFGAGMQYQPATGEVAVRIDPSLHFDTTGALAVRLVDGHRLVDGTVDAAKLTAPFVDLAVDRGLLGGGRLALGSFTALALDPAVVPDLGTGNDFHGPLTVLDPSPSVSQTTGAVVVRGGLGVGGDAFVRSTYNVSDLRLKRDVRPIAAADALAHVAALRGVTFAWENDAAGREAGLIAQEVRDVLPDCVRTDPATTMHAVNYIALVPYLVEAVKALRRECADLRAAALPPTSAPRGPSAAAPT